MKSINYIKQKREEIGQCNICGKITKLTWDHVPPKSTLGTSDMFANTVFNGIPTEDNHMKHYQSGIKYRTLCSQCNNVVLGKNDLEYKNFIVKIHEELMRLGPIKALEIEPGQGIILSVKINRVLRAIVGHILAMRTDYNDGVIPDIHMRKYVLDDSLTLENEYIYSWFYPYSTVINARDCVTKGFNNNSHPKSMVSVMNSFPISFLQSSENEEHCCLDDIGKYSTPNIDEEVEIYLNLSTLYYPDSVTPKHFMWPLNVSDGNYNAMFVLGGKELVEGSRVAVRK